MFSFFKKKPAVIKLHAPCTGTFIAQEQISDMAFSQGLLGPGFAIAPKPNNEGKVIICAPVSGTLSMIFPTKHALAFSVASSDKSSSNAKDIECILHIGVNTVELKGEGFKLQEAAKRDIGSFIKAGEELVEVDISTFKEHPSDVIVVLQNVSEMKLESIKNELFAGEELGSCF